MTDMKKTFQKEMKTAAAQQQEPARLDMEESDTSKGHVVVTNGLVAAVSPEGGVSNVDLAYLKHVIFKFLTSREYEVYA